MPPLLFRFFLASCLAGLFVGCASRTGLHASKDAGPWNLRSLQVAPATEWGSRTGLVQEVYYAGEPLNGRPTRVFAYLARPADAPSNQRLPAMVLVHGGGGKAFREWAEHWAKRGFVALAMDLSGNGPAGRLPDGGPDQSDKTKFRAFAAVDIPDMWTYHAVAAVVRGHSLVRSLPEVDPDRVGLTGISWGGYLTCIVAGVDHRFRVAVPVYGCGFLGDNSVWKEGSLASMKAPDRELWLQTFDPGRYLAGVECPILFLNGTTDFAYPLDSYQKSYRRVSEKLRHVSIVKDLPHGHIWTFPEVDAFVDAALRGTPGVVRLAMPKVDGNSIHARCLVDGSRVQSAQWVYTLDGGPWQKRRWNTIPATVESGVARASLPEERPMVGFLAVTDDRGLRTSSEHVVLESQ